MLYRLRISVATFLRLIQPALIYLFPKQCVIYLDGILAFVREIREHNANSNLVLGRL